MEAFKIILYSLAIVTSLSCTLLLLRGYAQRGVRLLMWSGICFAGLTINNVFLLSDSFIFPEVDLRLVRMGAASVGMLFLLYGFIWDAE